LRSTSKVEETAFLDLYQNREGGKMMTRGGQHGQKGESMLDV